MLPGVVGTFRIGETILSTHGINRSIHLRRVMTDEIAVLRPRYCALLASCPLRVNITESCPVLGYVASALRGFERDHSQDEAHERNLHHS